MTEYERYFRAGYHCQWIKNERRYIFDPLMKPGDPEGAYKAFLWSELERIEKEIFSLEERMQNPVLGDV